MGLLDLLDLHFHSSFLLDLYLHSFNQVGDDAYAHNVLDVIVPPHFVVVAPALLSGSRGDGL